MKIIIMLTTIILCIFVNSSNTYESIIPNLDDYCVVTQAMMLDSEMEKELKHSSSTIDLYEIDRKWLQSLEVTVTAYNNTVAQTDSTPNECAWGDTIRPGIIAISRDLQTIGLTRHMKVIVEGHGEFEVLDKMNQRFEKRIDIFMGKDIKKAKTFGKKELTIYWKE